MQYHNDSQKLAATFHKAMEDDIEELPLVVNKNRGKYVTTHYSSNKEDDLFTAGFLEAMDFMQYLVCWFSMASVSEIWPKNWMHFWNKFESQGKCVYKFYNALDFQNRATLYHWYKRRVNDR